VPAPVTTPEALADAVARLAAGTGPVAVDAERASGYRYGQRAYLVQLRRAGAGTVLVDPVPLPDLSSLGAALADTEWVLHAASQDLPCLAEVGMRPGTLFDTELAGRLLGHEKVGLGAMVERLLGLALEKGHSAADWSTRPLPHSWLAYAALDVEVLVELRDLLEAELLETGKLEWAREEFAGRGAGSPGAAPGRAVAAHVRDPPGARPAGARRGPVAVGVPGRAGPGPDIAPGAGAAGQRDRRRGVADPSRPRSWPSCRCSAAGRQLRQLRRGTGRSPRPHAAGVELPLTRCPRTRRRRRTGGPTATRTPPPASPPRGAALAGLSARHSDPGGEPALPDLVRRLAWSPPDDSSPAGIGAVLAAGGARHWQVELAAPVLADAVKATASVVTDQ
jgi:ribonuclease D